MLKPQIDISDPDYEEDRTHLGQAITDILRREKAHQQFADKIPYLQTPEGPVFRYDVDDQLMLEFMPRLQRLYASIMASDAPPVAATFVRWAQRPGFKLTRLGKDVLLTCKFFAEREEEGRDWQRTYADHQFHPAIAIIFRAVARWWSPIRGWANPNEPMTDCAQDMQAVEALRHLIRYVRRVCRSQAFQNLLHDHERKEKDNFRSGCDYVTEQFERHSRLLVLRIDLHFSPDPKGWAYCKVANSALTKYLRALWMGRIVPAYLGFIITREVGISRGMHFHLMVLLDGHLHRDAFHLTQRMGEAWIKRVGSDKGGFFNCYLRKDCFPYNGLGLVHVSDTKKLIGIRIALRYMSKQGLVLNVDGSKVKNFWRGKKAKGASNRGAPRKNGDGMELVKRMLGGERSKYPPGFEPPKNERARRMEGRPRIAAM